MPGSRMTAAPYKSKQIRVEYVLPKNPAHQSIYDRLKQGRALERIQTLLSPLRLPRPLLLKVSRCDGESNAWYDEGFVTVCYEFLADILKNAPEQTLPSGVTQEDAILGPLIDVFLHETGHAVFDQLKVPVLGREDFALKKLIGPYIDQKLAKKVLVTWMPDVNARPKYQPRCMSESRPAAVRLDCPAEKSSD
jgi:Putative metallopeptidase